MFTGLIADKARVISISRGAESAVIEIESVLIPEIKTGDSVSINGTCLTAIELNGDSFKADVMIQTLKVTSLGKLSEGDFVNLELATRADSRLGGHIVQGHVDGVAKVIGLTPGDKWAQFDVEVPVHLSKYIVNQGSICLDGVSLTVGEINDTNNVLTVWLIPETLERTNLSSKKSGDLVNVEVDVLAKYVERLLAKKDVK